MPFPTLAPTSRTFEAGDYPIKTFTSQSGVETRILYGSRRTGQKMSLTYQNIFDHQAEEFVEHYDEVFGTLNAFSIASVGTADGAKTGWNGQSVPDAFSSGGYSITVNPQALTEGSSFDITFKGPPKKTADETVYMTIDGDDIETSDFSSLFTGGALTGTASLDAQDGVATAINNRIASDGVTEGFEVMTIKMFSDSARLSTQLLASVSVGITDTNSTISSQPAAKAATIDAGSYSEGWRYEGPPQLTQVRPGISTVTVNLIGVLGAS